MDYNMFIIPLTLIFTELIKRLPLDSKWLPWVAVGFGAIFGTVFAAYNGTDYMEHIVQGIIYGASASGIYDATASLKAKSWEEN